MDKLITQLVSAQGNAGPSQVAEIIAHVARAPFTPDLLEADEPLWGSFWHFDVISPGYLIPAVELALLRATRLDGHWPETTSLEQFLTDLRLAIIHPQAGVFTLSLVAQPCLIVTAPAALAEDSSAGASNSEARTRPVTGQRTQKPSLVTVVWYCAATSNLHAGYRVRTGSLGLGSAQVQRRPGFEYRPRKGHDEIPSWLLQAAAQRDHEPAERSLAARLDAEIIRMRIK